MKYLSKKFLAAAVIVASVMFSASAQAALPKNYKEFKARYAAEGKTPEGAVKLHFDAIFCYMNENTRKEGSKMLRYSMRLRDGWERNPNYNTFASRMEDPYYSHVFRSYAEGTSLSNNYKMSPDNYRLSIVRVWKHPAGYTQVLIESSGADSPRPVNMLKHDGLWFVQSNGGVYVEIRRPLTEFEKTAHDADYDGVNYGKGGRIKNNKKW